MPVYFEYALKTSLCLAIVFLFYFSLLKRMTCYIWNRYYLLIFSLLSFAVPLIDINAFINPKQLDNFPSVSQIPIIANNKIPAYFIDSSNAINYWQILFVVYVLVVFVLMARLLIQLLSIQKIRSKSTLLVENDLIIYNLPEPVLPFSFFDCIYVNKDNYNKEELEEIISHEQVHVKQKHTFDVLMSEIIFILNWFNPFALLIKNAVRENLEFIADDVVIKKGVNRKNYQYLLLKVTGDIPAAITNNLKFSSLKNRFVMMNKTKTGKLHLLKFALVFPLLALLLFAFRNKQESNLKNNEQQKTVIKTYTLSSLTYSIPDKKVEAVVTKEQAACLLKTGEALSLELVYNERARLKNILEKNGFNDIGNHAIIFMIDTTLGNNSFSVQVNINLAKDNLQESKKTETPVTNKTTFEENTSQRLTDQTVGNGKTLATSERRQIDNAASNNQLSIKKNSIK